MKTRVIQDEPESNGTGGAGKTAAAQPSASTESADCVPAVHGHEDARDDRADEPKAKQPDSNGGK
jgi:hypothetical protein